MSSRHRKEAERTLLHRRRSPKRHDREALVRLGRWRVGVVRFLVIIVGPFGRHRQRIKTIDFLTDICNLRDLRQAGTFAVFRHGWEFLRSAEQKNCRSVRSRSIPTTMLPIHKIKIYRRRKRNEGPVIYTLTVVVLGRNMTAYPVSSTSCAVFLWGLRLSVADRGPASEIQKMRQMANGHHRDIDVLAGPDTIPSRYRALYILHRQSLIASQLSASLIIDWYQQYPTL